MKVNVYKIELLVIDFDAVGLDEIKEIIENGRYPNHCISPQVKEAETRTVAWSDDHPLNSTKSGDSAYRKLFGAEKRPT